MEAIKVYKCLAITSTMTYDTTYILSDNLKRLEAIGRTFMKLLDVDDNGEALECFVDMLVNDDTLVHLYSGSMPVQEGQLGDNHSIGALFSDGYVYLYDDLISYEERF